MNLLFYIIITPIITVTMNKIMYSSENQLIVTDAISRIESILEKKPLPETAHAQEPENNSITFEMYPSAMKMAEEMHCIRLILLSKRASMWHL